VSENALRVAVHMFNAGEYFEQHEILEELWRAEAGPIRELYQGILQVGVGLHHLERGNHHGAVTLLKRGIDRLGSCAPDALGIDVANLLLQSRRLHRELVDLGPSRMGEVNRSHHPRITVVTPDVV